MTVTEMVDFMAGSTGFEPATSGLTVQCANQAAPRARIGTVAGYTTPSLNATGAGVVRSLAARLQHTLHERFDVFWGPLPRFTVAADGGPRVRQLRR